MCNAFDRYGGELDTSLPSKTRSVGLTAVPDRPWTLSRNLPTQIYLETLDGNTSSPYILPEAFD